MHPYKIISLLALCLVTISASGQDTPDHEDILRNWFLSQRTAISDQDTLTYDEMAHWRIDAPFGSPALELNSNVRKNPFLARTWKRAVSARVNDRPVMPARLEEVKDRWQSNTRKQISEIIVEADPRPGLLQRMSSVSSVSRETIDDRSAWRVDVIRNDRRLLLERLTLWFDIQTGQLLRTRGIANSVQDGPSFVVTTNYENISNFDVPVRRFVEGSVRIKRRSRFYTVLISHTQEFSNFRIHLYTD